MVGLVFIQGLLRFYLLFIWGWFKVYLRVCLGLV